MKDYFSDMKQEYEEFTGVRHVPARSSFYITVIRRAIDIIGSLTALVLLSPVLIIVAIITLLDVGFPIIFKQVRIGLEGQPFIIYKFRNMIFECDENGELLKPDERVTRIGKIIRKMSLDELPQLFNILKGDMSFIGPRPLTPIYLHLYSDEQFKRHSVKPGLECPTYNRQDHVWTWEERFESDVWYVEHCSFRVDVHQFIRLVQMVFDKKSTKSRAELLMGRWNPEESDNNK